MADVDLGNLAVYLRARIDKLEADLRAGKQATEAARRSMQTNMDHITASTQRMGQGMMGAATQARVLATTIASVLAVKMLSAAEEIGDTAKQLGITSEALQGYRVSADIAGASSEGVTRSIMFFSRQLGDTTGEITPFRIALGQLGLRFEDIKRMGLERALETVSTALKNVDDSTRRTNLGVQLFQRGAMRTMNFLAMGGNEMRMWQIEAKKMGIVVSNELIDKAGEAKDQFDLFKTGLQAAGIQIAAGLLPVLQNLVKVVGSKEFQEGTKVFAENFGKAVKFAIDNKDALVSVMSSIGIFMALKFLGPAGIAGALVGGGALLLRDMRDEIAKTEDDITAAVNRLSNLQKAMFTISIKNGIPTVVRGEDKEVIEKAANAYMKLIDKLDQLKQSHREAGEAAEAQRKILEQINMLDLASDMEVGRPARSSNAPADFPQITKAIAELRVQRGVLKDEFQGFAEGFPEAFAALKLDGMDAAKILELLKRGASELTGQVHQFNVELAQNQGAKVWAETRTPLEKYNMEMEKLNALQKTINMDQDVFNRKAAMLGFPQLTAAINDMNNWRGQIDQLTTGSINKMADSLADIVTGTKDAKTAFKELAASVLRDLSVMIIKAQLFRMVSGAFGLGGGNILSAFGGGGLTDQGPTLAMMKHSGGIIGQGGTPRYVHPAYFDNAPRMHNGGRIGSNERAIIAEVGEVMLPKGSKVGGGVNINIYPAAPGETFEKQQNGNNIDLIGRMVDAKLSEYDRKVLPTRVNQVMADPRVR